MESLGVYALPSLTGLAAGGLFSLVTCLALVSFAFVSLVVSLAVIALPGFAPAPVLRVASTLSFEVVAVSLSLSFSASELVKFLSKEEPFVTINF